MGKRSEYAKHLPLESAFYIRTSHNYNAMKKRFGERRIKTGRQAGRVTQVGRPLPYTLDQFRDWLMQQFGGNPNSTCKCYHCPAVLDAMNVGFDHLNPVSQGGSLGLENLVPCCGVCNRIKGLLSLDTFQRLMRWLEHAGQNFPGAMTIADRADIIKRLRGGGTFYKTKKPGKAALVPVQEEVF